MAKTPSTMLPLGTEAPDFALVSTSGATVKARDFAGRPLLVAFICNHCPYVVHLRDDLAAFGRTYQSKGLGIVAINSNDADTYPDDSPANMVQEVQRVGYTFPYVFDATQATAQAYHAACTPDFFLFDGQMRLFYRGQYDDSRPGNGVPVTGRDLRAAVDAVLSGSQPPATQKPSLGCNIKWRPGRTPAYASALASASPTRP